MLFCQGVTGYQPLRRDRRQRLDQLVTGDGRPLPKHIKAQINRELDRLELLLKQIKAVERERDALLAAQQVMTPAAMLLELNGIGPEFATILWSEGLFRHFDNRRQVAAYAGLVPTPWQSGSIAHEQGVSKAGNPRLRATLIQLAWLWLRHQPKSALALWFKERVTRNGGRFKKTTIVAMTRKLLVALWKYVTAGVSYRGGRYENRLTRDAYPKSAIFQDLIVLADPGGRTVAPHGPKQPRFREWSRPPEPSSAASGILVRRSTRRPYVRLIWCGKRPG